MTKVYSNNGLEIGQFDGRFVYDRAGAKCYWIDDNEVFSLPLFDLEDNLGVRAAIRVGVVTDGVAIDPDGASIFSLNRPSLDSQANN